MKKLLLFIVIFPILCSAQTEYPLVKDGAVWRKTYSKMPIMPGDFYTIDFYQYVMQGDTIIDSLSYNKLYSENYDSIHNPIQYVGAIRETADNKVWFIKSSDWQFKYSAGIIPNNTEILLYDFGLQVGDTFTTIESDNHIVESIDSILVEGVYRKKWNFMSFFSQREWIEGIGDMKGFFFPLLTEFEDYQVLTCYEDNNTFWLNPELAEHGVGCYTVGVKENQTFINAPQVKVFPNPVSQSLNFEFVNSILNKKIIIYNSLGKQLLIKSFNTSEKLVNIDFV